VRQQFVLRGDRVIVLHGVHRVGAGRSAVENWLSVLDVAEEAQFRSLESLDCHGVGLGGIASAVDLVIEGDQHAFASCFLVLAAKRTASSRFTGPSALMAVAGRIAPTTTAPPWSRIRSGRSAPSLLHTRGNAPRPA